MTAIMISSKLVNNTEVSNLKQLRMNSSYNYECQKAVGKGLGWMEWCLMPTHLVDVIDGKITVSRQIAYTCFNAVVIYHGCHGYMTVVQLVYWLM